MTDGRGNTYVNNIGFDFPDGEFAPGLIALVSPDGTARQVAEGLSFPNGMAITPDNSTLIVAESYGGVLTAYDIAPDGDLSERRVWAELDGAAPDGICIDAEGAVWFAEVPGRRCVRVREGGRGVANHQLRTRLLRLHAGRPGRNDSLRDRSCLAGRDDAWLAYGSDSDGGGLGPWNGLASLEPRASAIARRRAEDEGDEAFFLGERGRSRRLPKRDARAAPRANAPIRGPQPGMRPSSDSLSSCRTSSSVESASGKIKSESSRESSGNWVPVVRIRSSSACRAFVS